MSGSRDAKLINVADYREAARRRLPRFVFDYVDGGAGDEQGLARNMQDMQRWSLAPRALRDISSVDTTIEVFGQRWGSPIAVAPIGFCGLVHAGADVMMAQAAAKAGVGYVLSTASNSRLEAVRRAAPEAVQWMQLYVMRDRAVAEQIVKRARREKYGALVLTVDVPVGGNRERDVRNGFKLPFKPSLGMTFDLLSHPRWLLRMGRYGSPRFANLAETEDKKASAASQAVVLASDMDRRLTWDSVDWLRTLWDGPLLIKGLLHPADAAEARQRGVDGIVVSNHGGRQLDGAASTISMLPRMLDAAGGQMPVFIDGGFRRGVDVVKAVTLGAKAVFVGRPPLYGLAHSGADGAHAVLQMLVNEVRHTMTLLGASTVGELESSMVMAQ